MADAPARPLPTLPWSVRLFEGLPVAPVWTGLSIVVVWWLIYLGYAFAAGWTDGAGAGGELSAIVLLFELLWSGMIGYLPTATAYRLRGAIRDLRALRPVLRFSEAEFESRLRELTRFDRGPLRAWGLAALAMAIALPYAPGYWVDGRPAISDPAMTWNWVRNTVLFGLMLRTLYIEVAMAQRFSRIGSEWTHIELLDLAPLAPLARRGLGSVLLLTGLAVLMSVLLWAPWETDYLIVFGLVSFLAVAVTALLLPVYGVHRRIRQVKNATLARLRAEILSQGDPSLEPRPDSRLPDLIAYKGLIDGVSTWPFDVTTLLRFGLYLTVGLGSWLGSAFVERLVDALLG